MVLFAAAVLLLALMVAGPSVVERVRSWLRIAEPPPARYLAVLPFAPLGEKVAEMTAISDGLAEILTTKLTQLTDTHDLQVAASSLSEGSPPRSVEEVGESLGVNLAIVGSLLRSGDDVRVTVNLVDVRERRQLRAEVINADLRDPFAFQDRIAVAVVEMLELELPPREEALLRAHGTTVAAAHQLYLQGRGYLRNYDQIENVDSAIRAFQQAVLKDPDYAQARAGLGMAYWKRYDYDDDPDWVERASEACSVSVKLDDRLAEGHACLGVINLGTGHDGEAQVQFGWAISLDPTHDEAFRGLARVYDLRGEPDAAEEVYRKAISIRPRYWAGYSWLAGVYLYQGRYADSEEMFRRVTELAPESYLAHSNLGGTYLAQGRFEDAIPVFQRSIDLKPNRDAYSNLGTAYFKLRRYGDAVRANQNAVGLSAEDYGLWGNLAESYYWSPGERDKAPQAYRRAVELALQQQRINPKDPEVLGELAKYHAMLGDREEAMSYLEQALRLAPADAELQFGAAVAHNQLGQSDTALDWLEKALAGGLSIAYVQDAPEFENLRGQDRFEELVTDTGSEESRAE
jgi:serine/threonine-protein kinase